MIRLLRWAVAAALAALALYWTARAVRRRPTHGVDPERPELRLRLRLSRAEHQAIVENQDAVILRLIYGENTDQPAVG